MDLEFAADENLRELSGEEAWETVENFAQGKKEWDNPPNIIFEQEIENLKVHAKRLFGNENIWVQMHRSRAWDKVENLDPQNRKAYLLEDKQIPSVGVFDEVYFSFGRHLDELHMIWAHLEKKRTRLGTNTKTLEDLCSRSLETASQAIHDTVTTHQVTVSQFS
ncbi:hypothetical protein Tco_1164118 [Tanacetum coccineum]